jgi:hypothetical protein
VTAAAQTRTITLLQAAHELGVRIIEQMTDEEVMNLVDSAVAEQRLELAGHWGMAISTGKKFVPDPPKSAAT